MQLTQGEKKRRRELRSKSLKIQVRHADLSAGSLIKKRGESFHSDGGEGEKNKLKILDTDWPLWGAKGVLETLKVANKSDLQGFSPYRDCLSTEEV